MTIYYCVIGQMFHSIKHDELKKSYVFNATMATHYQNAFNRHCKKMQFTRAAFHFLKWKHYDRKAKQIETQLQLTPSYNAYKN